MTPTLIDSNILVYANNLDSPMHEPCKQIIEDALYGLFPAFIAHQNLLELYAVVTDKRRVEKPLSPDEAKSLIHFYLTVENITTLYPTHSTMKILEKLIAEHLPTSHSIFDLVLVAMMMEHGITRIHTANTRHFCNFKEIICISPQSVEKNV